MADPFIHVGMHKTGTTFLQAQVFPALQNIAFYYVDRPDLRLVLAEDRPTLLSGEILAGISSTEKRRLTQRLARLFPEAGIIVGVRDAEGYLRSIYSQYIKAGGTLPFERFREIQRRDPANLDPQWYVELLRAHFRHVFVYDHRDLVRDPHDVVARLAAFLGAEHGPIANDQVNTALSARERERLRRLNRLFRTPLNPRGAIPRGRLVHPRMLTGPGKYLADIRQARISRRYRIRTEDFDPDLVG